MKFIRAINISSLHFNIYQLVKFHAQLSMEFSNPRACSKCGEFFRLISVNTVLITFKIIGFALTSKAYAETECFI